MIFHDDLEEILEKLLSDLERKQLDLKFLELKVLDPKTGQETAIHSKTISQAFDLSQPELVLKKCLVELLSKDPEEAGNTLEKLKKLTSADAVLSNNTQA